ncbi:ATP-binding protein [Halorubrum laminariae]|uniref:ATP-binding protein n=1 Tax=Halorubrum laminariae TaxID=1433523 RepID=A0ABD6C384_9EURY|nr:ATP-binding protein [Halorubrum laminariae]
MLDEGSDKNPPTPAAEFDDVVGQTELKRALSAVGANGDLAGALVRGEKGTGKSTLARALASYLPEQRVVADCRYGCPPDVPSRQCPSCRRRASLPVAVRPAPFVTLPLGATREAVVGSLSVADALDGDAAFDPGLLARANRGVLYVDEVNLLDDHLVDVVLDAAASGVNTVERDGVSLTHPAEFTLIGTMNPEEGALRPQLRDRFDLAVDVTGLDATEDRMAVVDRALDRDAEGDSAAEAASDTPGDTPTDPAFADPAAAIADARERLGSVTLPDSFVRDLVELCRDAGVDGHRADIAAARCARTLAALDGRTRVIEGDVREAASFALPHRLRTDPFEESADAEDLIDEHLGDDDPESGEGDAGDDTDGTADGETDEREDEADGSDGDETDSGDESDGSGERDGAHDGRDEGDERDDRGDDADAASDDDGETDRRDGDSRGEPEASADEIAANDRHSDPHDESADSSDEDGDSPDESEDGSEEATPLVPGSDRVGVGDAVAPEVEAPEAGASVAGDETGRSNADPSPRGTGPRVRTERATSADRIDAGASVRAAAERGGKRVEERDLRRSVRAGSAETLVCFAVDASASMSGPMRAAKGAAIDLLRDSYEHRDAVALVAFAGNDAGVLLPPTDDVGRAARHLKELPTGDRTPLAAGVDAAADAIARANADASLAVVVTDGGANGAERPTAAVREAGGRLREAADRTLVVDAGDAEGVVPTLLDSTGGERVPLSALSAERVDRELGGTGERETRNR